MSIKKEAQRRLDYAKRLREEFFNHNKNITEEKKRNRENIVQNNKIEEIENLKRFNDYINKEEELRKAKKVL